MIYAEYRDASTECDTDKSESPHCLFDLIFYVIKATVGVNENLRNVWKV